jgi:hypothetical protein
MPRRARRCTHLLLSVLVLVHLLAATVPVLAQEGSTGEAGVVVGTPELTIRECQDVSCAVLGLAPLQDPITVTGPAEHGFLPVDWQGTVGWAWYLFVATPAGGTPFLQRGTPGCNRLAIIINIGVGEPLQLDPLLWLQAEGVPATLFPMGWWAQAFPDEMGTLAMLGFPIGSHGDVPLDLTGFSDEDLVTTVQDSYAHIRQITGQEPIAYFTPYAANMDERVRNIIARLGYLPVFWEVPADDWVAGITPEQVYNNVVPNVVDGSIIEFHLDAPSSAESTAVALPRIVSDLRDRGFQFVTIPEMVQPCAW